MKAAKKINMAHVKGTLPVQYFKEGDIFIAFTPSLDLSTCGETFEEAKKNFMEAVTLFFEECIKQGTLGKVLASYGWQKVRGSLGWKPPQLIGEENFPLSAVAV